MDSAPQAAFDQDTPTAAPSAFQQDVAMHEPGRASACLAAAAAHLALGNVPGAANAFHQALDAAPEHFDAWLGLARCARARGDRRESLAHHRAAWAAHPDKPGALVEIGEDLLALGHVAEARAAFKAVLAREPGRVHVLLALARCARNAGDRAESLARHESARLVEPDSAWIAIEIGADLLALGDVAGADASYERARASDPGNVQALFGLGRCARARGDRARSLAHHEAALRAEPNGNVWAHVEIGADLLALNRVDAARAAYARANEAAPDNVQALFGLGLCARASGDHRRSLAFFETADRVAEPNHWTAVEIGVDLLALGETARARTSFERALALAPHDVQALLGRSRCAAVQGDVATAAALAQEAVAAVPANPELLGELAAHLRATGRLDAADAACGAAAALAPDRFEPLLGLALGARLRGDRVAALRHAERAHALAPDRAEPLVAMGEEQRALDRVADAEGSFARALAAAPDHLDALIGLASLARHRADRHRTLDLLRRARAANPGNGRAWLELAAELRALGRLDEARNVAQAWLDRAPGDPWLRLELAAIERCAGHPERARTICLAVAADHPHRAPLALMEAAAAEHALGHPDRAAALLERAAALDPGNATLLLRRGEQAMAERDPERALALLEAAHRRYPSEPGAALAAVEALLTLGRTRDAERTLDTMEPRFPAANAAIRRTRVGLLRRTGEWGRAHALALEAARAHPDDFLTGVERYQVEKLVGTEADAARAVALVPARARGEIAAAQRLAADWAEEAGDVHAAREALLRAESLDERSPEIQWDLCRLAMHALDLERARHHLGRYAAFVAGHVRARGGAVHPSQSHYGQILDELALDAGAVAHLRPLAARPAAERLRAALDHVGEHPDSTAAALFAMLAAREIAGAFGRRATVAPSPVPRRIAQYWNDPEPPPDIARMTGEWPVRSPGWSHARFDDAGAVAFLRAHHGADAAASFDRLREPAQKADLFRLALLDVEGGLYADADDRPRASAEALLDGGSTLILYAEDFGTIGNNMLAAVPGHPVIRRALAAALAATARGDRDVVWLSTGPGLLTRAFAGWLAEAGHDWRARLSTVTVLRRRELFEWVAVHCHAGYKRTARHWSISSFARARARVPESALSPSHDASSSRAASNVSSL